jgi:hypothetical protein
MLKMRDHGVADYADLHDMDGTDVGALTEDDRACLAELGEYLATTDAWTRFGVWLLHKHFEPSDGEVFVERTVDSPRGTRTAPLERESFGRSGLHATAFRFDGADEGVSTIGMEFAEPAHFGDAAPLSDEDEAVLAGIAERLDSRGKLDRFGVRIIRNPLGLSEGEVLHETSDSRDRTLNCIVADREALVAEHTVETTWRWRVIDGESRPMVMQECTATCVRVGEGHDVAHDHEENFGGND